MTSVTEIVDKILVEMLTENTGIALCDSGGTHGRLWQRNQGKKLKDFRDAPEVSWDGQYGGYTISVFHYLRRDLEIDRICEAFNKLNVPAKDWDSENFYGVSKAAEAYLLHGVGAKIGDTFNSYNGDSSISQVIQGTWVKINDENYLVLQIHGGADVRGGYTDARLFRVPGFQDGALLEDVYGTVYKKDGTQVAVDNRYTGTSLTTEDGKDIKIEDGDRVELELMPR